jgi:hypothetical protein
LEFSPALLPVVEADIKLWKVLFSGYGRTGTGTTMFVNAGGVVGVVKARPRIFWPVSGGSWELKRGCKRFPQKSQSMRTVMSATPRIPPTTPPTMAPVLSCRSRGLAPPVVDGKVDEEVVLELIAAAVPDADVDTVSVGGTAPNATPRASVVLKPPPDQALGSTKAYSGIVVFAGIGIATGKLPGQSQLCLESSRRDLPIWNGEQMCIPALHTPWGKPDSDTMISKSRL